MNIERKSSATAKAGLATGITGASLGVINMLSNGAGLLGGLTRNMSCVEGAVCSEDRLVNRFELEQQAEIAKLKTDIALRDANTFTDEKNIEMYKYVDGRLREIEKQLCIQEVQNQKTSDSFQIVNERLQCCCDSLTTKIENECRERKCADNTIVNYANATFYPKQVANVTTGTTTTAQVLYNPLPAQNCGKCCN